MAEAKNILCENIARFRKAAGMTQEELGKRLGVSTQAVSKWECGGTPDIMLLPGIADALAVSVDTLFGREAGEHTPLEERLDAEMANTPQERRFERMYRLCWCMMQGALCYERPYGQAVSGVTRSLEIGKGEIPFFRSPQGLQMLSLEEESPFYLLMPEPAEGYGGMLYNGESYEALFSLLAKPNRFRTLAYLECVERSFTPGFLGKKLGISDQEAEESLDDLQRHKLCYQVKLDTESGIQRVYSKRDNLNLLPLLLGAGLAMKGEEHFLQFDTRGKAMLKAPLGDGNTGEVWELDADKKFRTEFNT